MVTSFRYGLEDGETLRYEQVADMIQNKLYIRFQGLVVTVGTFLLVVFVLLGLCSLYKARRQHGWRLLRNILSTSNARAESRLKLSALRKMNSILGHAHELHSNAGLSRRTTNDISLALMIPTVTSSVRTTPPFSLHNAFASFSSRRDVHTTP